MKKNKFQGVGVAMITPFRKDGSINFHSLGNLVDYLILNKTDFLVILGTTSEAVCLNTDEKQAIASFVTEKVNNRIPIVLGIGGNNTSELINTIKKQDFSGIDGILSVVPYYNKPEQSGIYKHYSEISGASPVPLIIYNVPGRTGINMSSETCLRLAHDINNIVAVKEASGNLVQIMEILKHKPDDFHVLSGDDITNLPALLVGCSGLISVIGNAFPSMLGKMFAHVNSGRNSEAQLIHFKLLEITKLIFKEGNPAGIKATLNCMDLAPNYLRLPLSSVSRKLYNKISELIKMSELY